MNAKLHNKLLTFRLITENIYFYNQHVWPDPIKFKFLHVSTLLAASDSQSDNKMITRWCYILGKTFYIMFFLQVIDEN